MAKSARTGNLRLVDSPMPGPITLDISEDNPGIVEDSGGPQRIENSDGSVTFDFAPRQSAGPNQGFYANLAEKIDSTELDRIAAELLEDIQRDNDSRKEWLETRAAGIKLLGLKLEEPRGGVADSAPLEGMSSIRHPLLLESSLRFQANARGELLPAAGPVKVRNDTPTRPRIPVPPPPPPMPPPQMGHNGGPPLEPTPAGVGAGPVPPPPTAGPAPPFPPQPQPPMMPPPPPPGPESAPPYSLPNDTEELASALETDMNHYLTAVATEYYPDTDRMLFYVGFGGQGFKKVYNCPLRRRPVSESVDAENLIVSDATVSLMDCGRITHVIKMRPSVLKRMQIIGAYLDIDLMPAPAYQPTDPVKSEINDVQGINPQPQKPQNADHEIYETYCELDIAGYEHKRKGKKTGLQCPYKVTIHKESRQILEIRRNWEEGDDLCQPKQFFVEFPFVRALGFYGIGLVHIAGNTTKTLTAGWREMLDAGMFASFPGFIYAKGAGRQLSNQFRVAPGSGIGLDVGTGRLQDSVMPLPYRDPGAGFMSFMAHVEEVGQRVSGTAEVQVGEGTQEQPVGTTLALIEQATKVMDAVHKRLHSSQATEFKLLKERFKEDPEAFWRHNKKTTIEWQKEQFLKALENANIVPVADPNNPTSLHRIAKAVALKTLQAANPPIYDPIAVDTRIMRIVNIDPEGLFNKNPQAAPPDPKVMAAQAKAQSDQRMMVLKEEELKINSQLKLLELQDNAADRVTDEKIQNLKLELEKLRLIGDHIVHGKELEVAHIEHVQKLTSDQLMHRQNMIADAESRQVEREKIQATKEAAQAKAAAAARKPKPKGGK